MATRLVPFDDQTAQDIYQALLDRIGAAFAAGDFDTYAACFRLPHLVQTFDIRMTITSRAQLHRMFDDLHKQLALNNIASMTRHCTAAGFEDADTITGVHKVWLVNRTAEVHDTYLSLTTLRREDGLWQVGDSQFAGSDSCVLETVTRNQVPASSCDAPGARSGCGSSHRSGGGTGDLSEPSREDLT